MMKKRNLWTVFAAVMILALVIGFGCGAYVSDYYHADENAAVAVEGNKTVDVQTLEHMMIFAPEEPTAGFLFYPGGKVEYTAYAPLMLELAERDILCVLIRMPCNLAVLNRNAADGIPEQFPEIERWFIGGHSLGGSMAASYAAEHGEQLEGLVLLAAYSTADLTDSGLEVLSLIGSEDGVLNREKYESYRGNLPSDTVELIIQGGNHAGFGSYGAQAGDGVAGISGAKQIQETAESIAELIH